MSKAEALEELGLHWSECERCELAMYRENVVMTRGNPDAKIMFVGEAPGQTEDEEGLPFVGEAGKILDKFLDAYGFRQDEVLICNVVGCRPCNGPGERNRTPTESEVRSCMSRFSGILNIVQPDYLMLLGNVASVSLFPNTSKFPKTVTLKKSGKKVIAYKTYHPAAFLYGTIEEQLTRLEVAEADWARFRESVRSK